MASPESVHRLLVVATELLDSAVTEMRQVGMGKDIIHIGSALSEIFDVKAALYELQPALKPAHLSTTAAPEVAAANRRLTRYLPDALELDESGKTDEAVALLREYLELETLRSHRVIAEAEISRLLNSRGFGPDETA